MVIILSLAIELRVSSISNQTKDFYWWQKPCSLNVVQCYTTSMLVNFYRPNYIAYVESFFFLNNQATLEYGPGLLLLSFYFYINLNLFLMNLRALS